MLRASGPFLYESLSYPAISGEAYLDLGGFVSRCDHYQCALTPSEPSIPTVAAPGHSYGAPIADLIALQPWSTNPGYPFVDNFADQLAMIRASLTTTNIQEMSRVIRNGGGINLWIDALPYRTLSRSWQRA